MNFTEFDRATLSDHINNNVYPPGKTPTARPCSSIQLLPGDCRNVLTDIAPDSVHLIVTDPPYFLDGLDCGWKKGRADTKRATGSVGSLPVGMKFDPKQGRNLQMFMTDVGAGMLRILLPGGFAVVFSQPRLVHRLAVGLEDAGFEIRDLFAWRFTKRAQFKAFSMDHFIDRRDLTAKEKSALKRKTQGRKTPQLRPQFEAMVLAQKPRKGTFLDNWVAHETGLINSTESLDGRAPSTIMTVEKPAREKYNGHLTVKPVALIEHVIKLFSLPGQIVLDPFLGSGTTAVAALRAERKCIGIEINKDYLKIAEKRLEKNQ